MAINIEKLSLWEIAHRWHGIDPVKSKNEQEIPLEVKDTLRNLAAEIYDERLYTKWLLKREIDSNGQVYVRRWTSFWKKEGVYKYALMFKNEFENLIFNHIYDLPFLKSIVIPIWELEYWCDEYEVRFPDFWIRPLVFGGENFPLSSASKIEQVIKSDNEIDPENNSTVTFKDPGETWDDLNPHQKAAHAKHEPKNKFKRELVYFFNKNPKTSSRKITKSFIEENKEELKKEFGDTDPFDTLYNALLQYNNGKNKFWMNGIKDIKPEHT